jgi:hypothetical protein
MRPAGGDRLRQVLQPWRGEATTGPIKPSTGPPKVQIQMPEAAKQISDLGAKQKKQRGRTHKTKKKDLPEHCILDQRLALRENKDEGLEWVHSPVP